MGIRNAARLWMIGGIALTALLALATWFLLISPKNTQADEIRGQVADTQVQLAVLRKQIAGLTAQQAHLTEFKAELKANQRALPSDSGVPDFLRQLQASGQKTGVTVTGVTVAAPSQVTGVSGVWQLPITLVAGGDPDDLGRFLNDLQAVQPRAVLIQAVNLAENAGSAATPSPSASPTVRASATPSPSPSPSASAAPAASLNLTLLAYVAPPAGAGAPIVTTK